MIRPPRPRGPPPPAGTGPADLEYLARWLDEAFTVPGTRFRVGWDGVLGLIPGVGDLVTTVPALWIVMRALQMGVPNAVVAHMVGNILLESVIGSIPVIGDVFDFVWKANRRNVQLIDRYQRHPTSTRRRSTAGVAVAALALLVAASVLILIPILVLVWLIQGIA